MLAGNRSRDGLPILDRLAVDRRNEIASHGYALIADNRLTVGAAEAGTLCGRSGPDFPEENPAA